MRIDPDGSVLDDASLLERARDGDQASFAELVVRHRRAALRVAAVISGSTEEADDIVQEALVKAYRTLPTYRGTGTVRSWMLRVVANEAKNHVRGRVRRLRRDDRHARLDVRPAATPEDVVTERAAVEELASALGRMRLDDRSVLGCRYVAQLSERETAEVLGVAVGTVKSRTARALERLRSELAGAKEGS